MVHHIHCLFKIVIQIRYLVEDGLRLISQGLFAIATYHLVIYFIILIGHFYNI